jgi:hypothetical protein
MTRISCFFVFSSQVKLSLIYFGQCQKNKVLLYFIHKVKFYKDKVNMPTPRYSNAHFFVTTTKNSERAVTQVEPHIPLATASIEPPVNIIFIP